MSRILLLEDDEALGRGICMALETPNCTVTHCSTRLQAIKILQGVVFDLLILDINLPDGSGLELLRTLRQNGTSTPAILLTANDLELDSIFTFAFPLMMGMISGVYTSLCVSTSAWVLWSERKPKTKA